MSSSVITDWRSALDQKSGRRYYYNTTTGETTWSKPIELADGDEREEILRKRDEMRNFFSDMERNLKRRLENKSGSVEGARLGPSDDTVAEFKDGHDREREAPSHRRQRERRNRLDSKGSIGDLDFDFHIDLEEAERGSFEQRNSTTAGRLVRTISSLDDEILAMTAIRPSFVMTRNISRTNMAADDLLVGISSSSTAVSPSRNFLQEAMGLGRSPLDSSTMTALATSAGSHPRSNSGARSPVRKELPEGSKAKRNGSLRRNNSMSTIYVEQTLVKPDNERTIKCVCAVLRMHMIESRDKGSLVYPEYDVFKDNKSCMESPSLMMGNVDESEDDGVIPSLEVITSFFSLVYFKTQMEAECIIIALIYCERLLKITGGRLFISNKNWKSISFASLIMASKVWDDLSMWNVDFSNVFTSSFDLRRINELELAMLNSLKYNVKVTAAEYAKYYFHLRSMMARLGHHHHNTDNAGVALAPLDVMSARKLELSTQRYLDRTATMKRSVSVPDNMVHMTHNHVSRMRNSEKGMEEWVPTVFTERSALVGVEQIIGMGDR